MAGAFPAIGSATTDDGVRSQVERADWQTKKHVTGRGPLGVALRILFFTSEHILLDTDTDEFREEVVDAKSATPTWPTFVVERS